MHLGSSKFQIKVSIQQKEQSAPWNLENARFNSLFVNIHTPFEKSEKGLERCQGLWALAALPEDALGILALT